MPRIDNLHIEDELCPMWQAEYQNSIRSTEELLEAGLIGPEQAERIRPVMSRYQFVLPRYYASLIDPKDPFCPIRLQAIPDAAELDAVEGYLADPLADLLHQPKSRITQRFKGRVLVHLSPNCSLYCRFCFRKTLLNELKTDLFSGSLREAVSYVSEHKEIEEVIFSGGDPLMASDLTIRTAVDSMAKIPHLARIRFHTRVPVTFPARITDALVTALSVSTKPIVIVCHFNHPKELTENARAGINQLRNAGFTLLNQTVLLSQINDSAHILATLSRKLFDFGVLPYYLHQLDQASGTAHFGVSVDRGKEIYHTLKSQLSGYLVPRYVKDVVGAPYKTEMLVRIHPDR